MSATQRITWLLLTTGALFYIICAADDSSTTPPVSTKASIHTDPPTVPTASKDTAQTLTTVDAKAAVSTSVTPPAAPATTFTQAPTTAAPTPSVTVPATTKPVINTSPTQPTATNAPTNLPAGSSTISGALGSPLTTVTSVTASPTPSKTADTASTTASSSSSSSSSGGALAVSTSAPDTPTVQTSNAPGVHPKATDAPVTQRGVPGNVGTTKSSTDAVPSVTPPTSHSATSTGTSQQAGGGGTEKTTVAVTSQKPTAQPSVNTRSTLSPSTKTDEISRTRTEATVPMTTTHTITTAQLNTFLYSLNTGQEKDEKKELVEVCRQLMVNMQDGNCTLSWRHHNGKIQFECVEINGRVKTSQATQIYEEITKKQTDNKTLIAILASCGALLIMIVILAVCASHHRKPYHENQQHLTEELHTVENGYHDNPTLEVMEVQPEMQEKKMALNGEFNDSWIVPIDNLLKEDIPDEEDTHL